jgi:transcriptional regulator with XRE-family HTH domain
MKSIFNKEYELFIELLKEYRLRQNVTQAELAKKVGWANHTYVSKYETLERRLDFIEWKNVCRALKISPTEFLKEIEKRLKR